MEKLTIGQMARLNNVSERALRIYHEQGLLVPQIVDKANSYRYYSRTQSRRLNMILQMKSVGFSLKQIKDIIDNKNILMLQAVLLEQIDAINGEISELQHKERRLREMLESCKSFLNPPSLHNIFAEYRQSRTAYFFDTESFNFVESGGDGSHWEKILEEVRSFIQKHNMPITYFSDVGCIIKYENLISGSTICDGAFITPQETTRYPHVPTYEIKAGTYICMYDRRPSGDTRSEARGRAKLLSYIKEKDFKICGDYICEVTAESSVFDSENHISLVKMQIPVHITQQQGKEKA